MIDNYLRKLKPLQWKSQDVVKLLPMDTALSLMVTIMIFEDFEMRWKWEHVKDEDREVGDDADDNGDGGDDGDGDGDDDGWMAALCIT